VKETSLDDEEDDRELSSGVILTSHVVNLCYSRFAVEVHT